MDVENDRSEKGIDRREQGDSADQPAADENVTEQSVNFERPGVHAVEYLFLFREGEHRVGYALPEVRPVASVVPSKEEVVEVDEDREEQAVGHETGGFERDGDFGEREDE